MADRRYSTDSRSPISSINSPSSPTVTRGDSSLRLLDTATKDDTFWMKFNKRLKTPKIFYPLRYGRKMRDMEIWDHKFFTAATGQLTLSPQEAIPHSPVMLDLACGYGHWCIAAAQHFKDSQIVGIDMADIQPDLHHLGYQNIADRVTWVQGNILEDLPFPDNYFDLVRCQYIEFCVPEPKWGSLFAEISRILKPGGIFETIQEIMIFPCPRFPPRSQPPKDIETMKAEGDEGQTGISKELADTDPRDHSRLKSAFEAMIEVRFLNSTITSTLPFYMELQFENVQMTPTIHVLLPPSSFVRDQGDISGAAVEPESLEEQNINLLSMLRMDAHAANLEITSNLGGQMHLCQTMNLVLSCKEAIWEQFEVLNPTLKRSDFDYLMRNWEFDMRDRIGMRDLMKQSLNWIDSSGYKSEDPHWKAWRNETLKFHKEDGPWDAQSIPEPCRSERGFRGTKPR